MTFNLSEKIFIESTGNIDVINSEDVKEFIRLLKKGRIYHVNDLGWSDDEEMIVDAFLQRSRRLSAGEIVSES